MLCENLLQNNRKAVKVRKLKINALPRYQDTKTDRNGYVLYFNDVHPNRVANVI